MSSVDIPPEQGSLERLGIAIETEVPESVLKPSAIRSLRFRQQEVRGYYTKDVESFVLQQTLPSVEWYIQRIHARDLDVHRLGEELDRLEVDMVNLRGQFELAAASAPMAAVIAQAEQDPEVEAIVARARQDQADLAQARLRIAALEQDLAAAAEDGGAPETAALTRIAELEEEAQALAAERDQYASHVQELEEYATQQDDYIDALLARIPEENEAEAEPDSEELSVADEFARLDVQQDDGDAGYAGEAQEVQAAIAPEQELVADEYVEDYPAETLHDQKVAAAYEEDEYFEEAAAEEASADAAGQIDPELLEDDGAADPAAEFGYSFGSASDDDFDLVDGADELVGQEPERVEYEQEEVEPEAESDRNQPRHVWNGIELPGDLTPEDFE